MHKNGHRISYVVITKLTRYVSIKMVVN